MEVQDTNIIKIKNEDGICNICGSANNAILYHLGVTGDDIFFCYSCALQNDNFIILSECYHENCTDMGYFKGLCLQHVDWKDRKEFLSQESLIRNFD